MEELRKGCSPPAARLAEFALATRLNQPVIEDLQSEIYRGILERSRYVRVPNFSQIHTGDLMYLFDAYDQCFFGGLCRAALAGDILEFRLSNRMSRSGGMTMRSRGPAGKTHFEITVSTMLLFQTFRAGEMDREVTVAGLAVDDRTEALQRIFEHELIHWVELACWEHSKCAHPRFQTIASRIFGHQEHTHNLVTQHERAAAVGIRNGEMVEFTFEGRTFRGRVNRITRRATVLVDDPNGIRYTDGRVYRKFYVPISALRRV